MRPLLAVLLGLGATLSAAGQHVPGIDPLEQAKSEFQAGRIDAALTALDEMDKRGAPAPQALDLRGCIYLEQQKFEEADKAFRAAYEIDPKLSSPRLHFADSLLRQAKWDEARAAYEPLLKETNILGLSERLRYAILLTYLGAKDDAVGSIVLERIRFPTETAAYYYAHAAWAFAHGDGKAGSKWMRTAEEIFDAKKTAWFARPLYDRGWIKTKPPLSLD